MCHSLRLGNRRPELEFLEVSTGFIVRVSKRTCEFRSLECENHTRQLALSMRLYIPATGSRTLSSAPRSYPIFIGAHNVDYACLVKRAVCMRRNRHVLDSIQCALENQENSCQPVTF